MSSGWENFMLSWLVRNAGQAELVKNHLRRAVREVLLAAVASLEVARKELQRLDGASPASFPQSLEPLVGKAESAVRLVLGFLPADDAQGASDARRSVFTAVLAILDEEIAELNGRNGESARVRREALAAIRLAFSRHMGIYDADQDASRASELKRA